MNNIDILEEPKDILYQIDMKLYDEFNDKFCEINENLGTVYSYKDLEDLKKAESDTERRLLKEAISTLIAENKELKDSNVELATIIDCLQTDLKEIKENSIPKSKLKAKIEEVEQWGLYNMKIPKLSTLDERLGAKIGIKYVLQSLLGKE